MNFWSDLVPLLWCFCCHFSMLRKPRSCQFSESCMSLASSPTTAASDLGEGTKTGPSSPAFQICWAALRKHEARWFISWGFAGNEGNVERAALRHIQAETAFGCRRCCTGVDHLLRSCVLMKTACLGLRPFAGRWILLRKAWPSWCCTSSGKGLELYGRALQKSTDTGVSLPLFLWIHKALPAIPLNLFPNIF